MNKFLPCYAVTVALATFLLILAGGLVTSHEAGLAVPDWPLSYGQLMPPMVGNVFWEHGHRMIAGTVGILTLILAFWIQFSGRQQALKILGWAALGTVVLQAVLGGLTVIYMLPPAVSIFHACIAQTFFCLVIGICYFLNPEWGRRILSRTDLDRDQTRKARRFVFLTLIFVYGQLILGAVVRHTGHAIVFHIFLAFLILIHGLLAALQTSAAFSPHSVPGRLANLLGLLLVIQLSLGMGSFIFTRMLERGYAPSHGEVVFTAAHQTLGAAILGLYFLTVLVIHHGTRSKAISN